MIATRPAPNESLATYAKRCAEQERAATRPQRAKDLLALIACVLTWPADRVSIIHGPGPKYETHAQVDGLLMREIDGHLLVAGQVNDWHEVRSAAELGTLMRSGRLQGVGL